MTVFTPLLLYTVKRLFKYQFIIEMKWNIWEKCNLNEDNILLLLQEKT